MVLCLEEADTKMECMTLELFGRCNDAGQTCGVKNELDCLGRKVAGAKTEASIGAVHQTKGLMLALTPNYKWAEQCETFAG